MLCLVTSQLYNSCFNLFSRPFVFFLLVFVHSIGNGGELGVNRHVVKSTFVSALGGLLFGFDTAVIAGTTHQLSMVYRLNSFFIRVDGLQRALGHCGRRDDCRISGRAVGPPGQPANDGRLLLFVGARLCIGMELGIADHLPHYWRARYWRVLSACAHVHRRVVACEVARTSGWILPDHYCCWHPPGLLSNFLIGRMNLGRWNGVGCWELPLCRRCSFY